MKTLKSVIEFTKSAEFANAVFSSTDSSPQQILKLHAKIVTLANDSDMVRSHIDMVEWNDDADELNETMDDYFSDIYANYSDDEIREKNLAVESATNLRQLIGELFPSFSK